MCVLRWIMLLGAVLIGIYGMAAVAFAIVAYTSQAESFDVPFSGEGGFHLYTGPDRTGGGR